MRTKACIFLVVLLMAVLPYLGKCFDKPSIDNGGDTAGVTLVPNATHCYRGGGPDAFGYTWNDHPYNWIDIRGLPHTVEVRGFGDDNVVGFFDFALDPPFTYFWYEVDRFCIGSNGYISFSDNRLMAHPFQRPPSTRRPDNVLFAFVDDLTFIYTDGDTGHVYYNYEDFGDSLIVQYQNVPFWGNNPQQCEGLNTFEIILAAQPDTQGLIIYQWEHQEGEGSGIRYIGWEDRYGIIGWEIPNAEAAPGEAIIIEYTDPTGIEITDMAVVEAITEENTGFFIYRGATLEIGATLKNTGNQDVTNVTANCVIQKGNTTFYDETRGFGDFIPGQVKTYYWDTHYECIDGPGTYTITVRQLLEDYYPDNDEVVVEMHVITLPTEMSYIGDDVECFWCWWGKGSWAVKLCVPDSVPGDSLLVDEMSVYICSGTLPCNIGLALIDDNGPEGSPGDSLVDTTITIPVGTPMPDWLTVQVDPPYTFKEGDCLYATYIQPGEENPILGRDEDPPFSYQGWELIGGIWKPYRDNENEELGIKVHTLPGALHDLSVTLIPDATTVEQGGTLGYAVEVINHSDEVKTFQYWSDIYLWNGEPYKKNPVFGPLVGTLQAGQIKTGHITHRVPDRAPCNTYTLCGRIGFHPDGIWNEDCFRFEVVER